MPRVRKCCIRNCNSQNLHGVSYHYFPVNLYMQWRIALADHADIECLSEYSTVCSAHFKPTDFNSLSKRRTLVSTAIPSLFHTTGCEVHISENYLCNSKTQTTLTAAHIENMLYTKRCLEQKLRRTQLRYNKMKHLLQAEREKNKKSKCKCMEHIKKDAVNMDPRAILLLDQIRNYNKEKPTWSNMTISQCLAWRFTSRKGYEFPRSYLLKLPCHTTLRKYLGTCNQDLLKNKLKPKSQNLNVSEPICSLIIDDMALKESM